MSAGQDGNLFVMDLGFMDDQNNFIIRTRSYKKVKGTGANDDDHAYIGPGKCSYFLYFYDDEQYRKCMRSVQPHIANHHPLVS